MNVRILGCSGGATGGLKTTSLLVDDDILIDAGTGVDELTLAEMQRLRHIFLTHSHLDHLVGVPFICDMVLDNMAGPITVHAREETLDALRRHIFNWVLWPDFAQLPDADAPILRYSPMVSGDRVQIGDRTIEMVAVNHSVPGAGYCVESPTGAFAFSGDTTTNDGFWEALNRYHRLDLLIVETAFADEDLELSRDARHYCPQLLAADLNKLQHQPEIFITHLKPGAETVILDQAREAVGGEGVERLFGGEVFQL